ncbi:MAG: hypothetical protein AB8V23_02130 [Candidatus Midichloria sp.]|uniref:Uncharacterized protein n=1 Tax=Hyalomma marginatum TaxID=34627 RepID=A0A8S4C1C9_9ACAR|nr:hypothetical protein MHYMCMPASI_00106 [Hyalomma marginatum]CAG7590851.1 hypothetical protein MHYMCMPSP_00368 [Hyalomma marginatum]
MHSIGFNKEIADKAAALIIGKEQELKFIQRISLIQQYEDGDGKYH